MPRGVLSRFRDQVVIRVADDFDRGELAHWQFPAHINTTVDVRGIGLAAMIEVRNNHGWVG